MPVGRVVAGLGLAVLTGLGAAGPAYAHGDFVDGSPGPGDTVAAGSTLLRLSFASIDEGSTADVTLTRTGGQQQPIGAALPLPLGRVVCARTEPLAPGIYTVSYALTSPDGAVADGGYVFEVVAAGEADDEITQGACAGQELRAPVAPAVSTAESDSPAPLFAAVSAVGVVVIGAVVVALRRRQADA